MIACNLTIEFNTSLLPISLLITAYSCILSQTQKLLATYTNIKFTIYTVHLKLQ